MKLAFGCVLLKPLLNIVGTAINYNKQYVTVTCWVCLNLFFAILQMYTFMN